MDGGTDAERLSFLGRRLPPAFEVRLIAVAPGCERVVDDAEWRDTLVVVERGVIDVECARGAGRRFGPGDVLWLVGLEPRSLRNRGRDLVLLSAVSRRRPGSDARPR
jgi:hypothetical protein